MITNRLSVLAAVGAIALLTAPPSYASGKIAVDSLVAEGAGATMKADELVGKDITNPAGETIGEVESVIIRDNGKVAAVVVGVGGFLGVGERLVALEGNSLRFLQNGKAVQTNMSKAQLKALPEYQYEKATDRNTTFMDRRYAAGTSSSDSKVQRDPKSAWIEVSRLRASNVKGTDVINPQGEKIGEVNELVVDDGRAMLILSVGEVLGIGGHEVAIDLEKAKIYRQRDDVDDIRISIAMSKEQIKALPKFDAKAWANQGTTKR